jgi:hypothetical protein
MSAERAWRTAENDTDGAPMDVWWDSTKDAWIDGYETGYRAAAGSPDADLLRLLCDGWDDFDDDARLWQQRMDALVDAARAHLSPMLAEDDPPTTVRSVP